MVVLKLELRNNLPVPTPGPRDVLIRVTAAGVNDTDINTRTGWYSKQDASAEDASWSGETLEFPRIQGADVCGQIGGPMVELDVRTLYLKDLSFYGCTVLDLGVFGNLVKYIEQGDVAPLVAMSFPLERRNNTLGRSY